MKQLAFFILPLGLMGCFAPAAHDYQVWIDPTLSPEQVETISQGLLSWQAATQGGVQFHVWIRSGSAEGHSGVISIRLQDPGFIQWDCSNSSALDCTDGPKVDPGAWANTWLRPNFSSQEVMHEVGHAMGLVHTGDGTVMCQSHECAVPYITCTDIQQYFSLRPGMVVPACE